MHTKSTSRVLRYYRSSDGSTSYEVRLGSDGRVYCTCPGWKFSRKAPKTCKHVEHFLGIVPVLPKVHA